MPIVYLLDTLATALQRRLAIIYGLPDVIKKDSLTGRSLLMINGAEDDTSNVAMRI